MKFWLVFVTNQQYTTTYKYNTIQVEGHVDKLLIFMEVGLNASIKC